MKKAVITLFLALSGGQGKSVCTYTTGIKLSQLGYPVLLVDADPQHNLTDWLRVEIGDNEPTLYEVIKGEVKAEDAIYPVPGRDNLYIIPCDRILNSISFYLASQPNPSVILRKRLEPILGDFAAIVIDSPPQAGHITHTAIGSADLVVVPVEATSKGIGSLADSKNLLSECADASAFRGEFLGAIPFRAKLAGMYFTKDTRQSIADMNDLLGEGLVLPPVVESEVYKNSLNFGRIPSELAPDKAELERPFDELIARMRPNLVKVEKEVVNG